MLHYFAKNFFHATILSACVERDNVSLYYISDDVVRQSREFDGQHRDSDGKQFESREFGSRLDQTLRFVSVFDDSTFAAKDSLNRRRQPSVTVGGHYGEGYVDDVTVNFQHAVNSFSELRREQEYCIVRLQCFRWSSFEPSAEWNITFRQVCILIVVRSYTLL